MYISVRCSVLWGALHTNGLVHVLVDLNEHASSSFLSNGFLSCTMRLISLSSLLHSLQLQAGARSVQRTIRNNFMDSTKQDAIDMLLFNNAFSGELGQKARAFLEKADIYGKFQFHVLASPLPIPILFSFFTSTCSIQEGSLWPLGRLHRGREATCVHWNVECEWRSPHPQRRTQESVNQWLASWWSNTLGSGKGTRELP